MKFRRFLWVVLPLAALAVVAACNSTSLPNPPPTNQFYWPAGLVFAPGGPGGPADGTLFVVNANFDRRFDNGSLVALNLSQVGTGPDGGLPPFGAPVPPTGPKQITALNLSSNAVAPIASFGALLAAAPLADGGTRLFVPSRSEGHYVFAVDAVLPAGPTDQPQLFCVRPENFDAGTFNEKDCRNAGMTTMANLYVGNGLPRAPAPYGVAISKDGNAYVTHLQNADSPVNSTLDPTAYIVKINVEHPQITNDSFINVFTGGTDSVVAGKRWVYTTGRYFTPIAYLLRMVDANGDFLDPGIENPVKSLESRGVALSSDESRVYIAGRSPDVLIVCSIEGADTDSPLVKGMHTTQLPASPDQLVAIPRAGRSDLIVIVSSAVGTVSFYDDDLGSLVGQVAGVGQEPFAIAVDPRDGMSARLFVSNFTDGRVAVIDVPDLTRPDQARIVADLSAKQLCMTQGTASGACDGGT